VLNVDNGGSCTDLAQEEIRTGVLKAGSRECFFYCFRRRHRYGFGREENLIHRGGRGVSRRLKVYVLLLYEGRKAIWSASLVRLMVVCYVDIAGKFGREG
jgi:hypothetical protein